MADAHDTKETGPDGTPILANVTHTPYGDALKASVGDVTLLLLRTGEKGNNVQIFHDRDHDNVFTVGERQYDANWRITSTAVWATLIRHPWLGEALGQELKIKADALKTFDDGILTRAEFDSMAKVLGMETAFLPEVLSSSAPRTPAARPAQAPEQESGKAPPKAGR